MSKKKKQAPQPEAPVATLPARKRPLADWEVERAQALDRPSTTRRVCRTCKRPLVEYERTPTDALMDIAEHHLIGFAKMHTGEAQNWELRDAVLNWLDATPNEQPNLAPALERLARDYPLLGALLASQLRGDTFRDVATELGISHPTVGTMVSRLQNVLGELLRNP